MKSSRLSLKWLEIFVATARCGTVQDAAAEAGVSVSTASHHLRQLENTLDTSLFDHSRRPLRLTASGAVFQRDIDAALKLIAKAEANLQAGNLRETRTLSLAMIEDFDTDIAPELARILTEAMPKCRFRHLTRPSHDILTLLRNQDLDVGFATRPEAGPPPDLLELPVLREPFVMALPGQSKVLPEDALNGRSDLAFLRYSDEQIMARQIEAQLRRLKRDLPDQHMFDSNQTLMRLVAEGAGWAITTPMNFLRARAHMRQIRLAPFPAKGFARTLSVFTTDLADAEITTTVTETLRRLIANRAVTPLHDAMPWLADRFHLIATE